jgi:CheY-like chemotaxis protein
VDNFSLIPPAKLIFLHMDAEGLEKRAQPINLRLKKRGMPDPRKILLVDDDLDHLSICKLILTNRGYNILVLWNTDVLVEVVKDFMPDLIFMDHRMPRRDGIQATQLLKANESTKDIPVIYFSGVEKAEQFAKEAGADGFLPKPFNVESLLAAINKYLP